MHRPVLTPDKKTVGRRAGLIIAALAVAASFASCKNESEPAPEPDNSYYPVAVGNFWIYAVADTSWTAASLQGSQVNPSVATASAYQFRETITETFPDAAGKTAYRMVRAKRLNSTAEWRDDSVFVLSATDHAVVLNRNNARTVELIFPAREGRSWTFNAFNNDLNDTITAETRQYSLVGQSFTTGGGATGLPAVTYPATATTNNTGAAAENTLLRCIGYQQVFAKGVGPVFRRRVTLAYFNYTQSNGNQAFPPNAYFGAFTRRETLIDYGPKP